MGADFELLVILCAESVGLEKDFRDIAFPELVSAAIDPGIGEDVNGAVAAAKTNVELRVGPQKANLGLPLRIPVLALPIMAEADGHRVPPVALSRKSIGPNGLG